jgi:hypothetical protein
MFLVVIETDAAASEDGDTPGWVVVCTYLLLVIYTTELAVKLYVSRWDFFKEMWNVLDFLIVGTDLVFLFISLIVSEMPSISILRVFRLVRLARAFKAAKSFRELKSLLRSCACALKAIFWGMVMLTMALTVWGILAVQLIHPVNEYIAEHKPYLYEGCERCPRAYSTVFDSMLTFWKQLVAGDSWGTLCEPIIEEAKWTSLFFMMVLVTVNLTMLNCILAVVVEAGASAAAADDHDKAMEREKTVFHAEERLIDLCHGLDCDSSGSLSIDEFFKGFQTNEDFKQCLELMHVTEADMSMIFNICDEDDSGDVDYREFVEQLRRIKHSSEQIILHYVTDIRHKVMKIRSEFLKPPTKLSVFVNEYEEVLERKEEEQFEGKCDEIKGTDPIAVFTDLKQASDFVSEAKDASTDVDGQLASAALATEEVPQVLAELNVSGGFIREGKASNTESRSPGSVPLGADGMTPSGVIWQVREDLVNIMNDLAEQSKVQTQLLHTLVGGYVASSARVRPADASCGGCVRVV